MKTVLGAIALVMVMSAPALAQRSPYNGYQNPSFYNNQSPAARITDETGTRSYRSSGLPAG